MTRPSIGGLLILIFHIWILHIASAELGHEKLLYSFQPTQSLTRFLLTTYGLSPDAQRSEIPS
jgi:hypothetical protein